MAHIVMRPHPERGAHQIVINGVDYSNEIYDFPELAEVGLRVTFALSRLDLGDDADVDVDVEATHRLRVAVDPAGPVAPGNLVAVLRQVADDYREQTVAIRELREAVTATEQRIAALTTPAGAPRAYCEPQVTGGAYLPPADDQRLAAAVSQGARRRRQDDAR